jgi:hypothetical protein
MYAAALTAFALGKMLSIRDGHAGDSRGNRRGYWHRHRSLHLTRFWSGRFRIRRVEPSSRMQRRILDFAHAAGDGGAS